MEHHAPRRSVRRWIAGTLLGLTLVIGAVAGVSAHGFGGPGGGPGGGPAGAATITAINGSQLSLTTANGWSRTLDAANASITGPDDATLAFSDLQVGDEVRVHEAPNFDGSSTVTEIAVVAPHVDGTATAVTDTSVTVHQSDGSSRTVTLTDSTTYSARREAAAKADLTVGSVVRIEGTENADGSFTASSVSIRPAGLGGTVTATTADSITVQDAAGNTATIHVTASTTYRTANGAGTLADVTVGSVVRAEGVKNADGSLNATAVAVGNPDGRFGGFGGPGGRHGARGEMSDGATPSASPSASPTA
jgi:tRNA-binding EMAP/Myf-like protein